MTNAGQIYGRGFLGVPPHGVSVADHIHGIRLLTDHKGRPDAVEIQWHEVDKQAWQTLQMDYPNALFLLSCLKSMQLDQGTPFPDDPRANQG